MDLLGDLTAKCFRIEASMRQGRALTKGAYVSPCRYVSDLRRRRLSCRAGQGYGLEQAGEPLGRQHLLAEDDQLQGSHAGVPAVRCVGTAIGGGPENRRDLVRIEDPVNHHDPCP